MTGSRPVLVTFEIFKDREEVLRKGNMLKGSSIHIGEDLSKRIRESRGELRKYMRKIKKANPDATCILQYDKLYVNNKIYVFNDLQGRVSSLAFSSYDRAHLLAVVLVAHCSHLIKRFSNYSIM